MLYPQTHQVFYFNPHSHAGSDPLSAPPLFRNQNFNPHSHAGSDFPISTLPLRTSNFNPHSHAGSDLISSTNTIGFFHFNPHSHAGSDCVPPKSFLYFLISIHTPTQGVTPEKAAYSRLALFQSTLPRRE